MSANLENPAVAIGLEMVSFHSNPKEGQCQRMLNYPTIALISYTSKVIGYRKTANYLILKYIKNNANDKMRNVGKYL